MGRIRLKRAYEPAGRADGRRFLVERLWPRGVTKEALAVETWLKDVAPSAALRTWYGHDAAKWPEFRRRYLDELAQHDAALAPLREALRRGPVTLVFAARAPERSSAAVLREYLEGDPARPPTGLTEKRSRRSSFVRGPSPK